uniref:Uncharacterized protein n=1 Tax=Plectus sambesii TaxID=2011161 RepID=A0A914W693_9BILA
MGPSYPVPRRRSANNLRHEVQTKYAELAPPAHVGSCPGMTSGSMRSRPSAPPVQAGAAVWIICIYISILLESVQCRGTFHRYQFVLNAMSSQVEAFEWTKSSNFSPSEQSVAVLKLTLSSQNKNTTRSDADTVAAQREWAAAQDEFDVVQYVKEEIGYRVADKIYDLTQFSPVCLDIGCGAGHIAPHVFK